MSSFPSSSSTNRTSAPSSPNVDHRSLNNSPYGAAASAAAATMGINYYGNHTPPPIPSSNSSHWNAHSLNEHLIRRQAIQLANQLQHQLHIDNNNNNNNNNVNRPPTNNIMPMGHTQRYNMPPPPPPPPQVYARDNALFKEELMQRLKAIIHIFMMSPNQRYTNNNMTFCWSMDDDNDNVALDYSVTVVIKQPCHLV